MGGQTELVLQHGGRGGAGLRELGWQETSPCCLGVPGGPTEATALPQVSCGSPRHRRPPDGRDSPGMFSCEVSMLRTIKAQCRPNKQCPWATISPFPTPRSKPSGRKGARS